jgi:hypothetical protein
MPSSEMIRLVNKDGNYTTQDYIYGAVQCYHDITQGKRRKQMGDGSVQDIIRLLKNASESEDREIGFEVFDKTNTPQEIVNNIATGIREEAHVALSWPRYDIVNRLVDEMRMLPGMQNLSLEEAMFPGKEIPQARYELAKPSLASARKIYANGDRYYDDWLVALDNLAKIAELTGEKAELKILDETGQKSNEEIKAEIDSGLRSQIKEMYKNAMTIEPYKGGLEGDQHQTGNKHRRFTAGDIRERLDALSDIHGKKITFDDVMGEGVTKTTVATLISESREMLSKFSKGRKIDGRIDAQRIYAPLTKASDLSGKKIGIAQLLEGLEGVSVKKNGSNFRISSANPGVAEMLEAVLKQERESHAGYVFSEGGWKIDEGGNAMSVKRAGNHIEIRNPDNDTFHALDSLKNTLLKR